MFPLWLLDVTSSEASLSPYSLFFWLDLSEQVKIATLKWQNSVSFASISVRFFFALNSNKKKIVNKFDNKCFTWARLRLPFKGIRADLKQAWYDVSFLRQDHDNYCKFDRFFSKFYLPKILISCNSIDAS